MGAPQPEIDECSSLSGVHATGRLGGHHGLKADGVDQEGFYDLGLDQRGGNLQKRLAGKENSAFGHGHHVAAEAKAGQVIEKAG